MEISLLAEVTRVEAREEYPKKSTGETNWGSKKIEVILSTLTILNNPQNVTGQVTVQKLLQFGAIYQISVNDTPSAQVVVDMEVSQPKFPES